MAQIVVRDLDPKVIEQLRARARSHGRSLEDEIKAILKTAAPLSMREARAIAEQWQRRLAGQITGDSSDLLREDRTVE
ncbi:MAG TPA: Arc family DNA-binding protein [Thermoanaerobaculia bacterium]